MTTTETVAFAEAQLAERGTSPAGILLGDQPSREELGALLGWADAMVEKSIMILKAPFPWFGGKSRVAPLVWERFGNVPNFCEPFFGSGAVLLGRPHDPGIETVNDKDGFLANAWRAIAADPDAVARWCDWPVNENDLHARNAWLKPQRAALSARLEGDPDYFDAKLAGWWVWGMACWIGSGFCTADGPWAVVDGELRNVGADSGTKRQRPHLGDAGQGIARQRPHLGDAGRGIAKDQSIYEYMRKLQARMRRVRVCCGNWDRILGPSPTFKNGITGVFLDPPYSAEADRDNALYGEEDASVAHDVRRWCIANQDNPLLPACHETNMERMRTGKGDMVRDLWYASTGCPYHGKIEKIDSAQPSALSTKSEGEEN